MISGYVGGQATWAWDGQYIGFGLIIGGDAFPTNCMVAAEDNELGQGARADVAA